MTSPSDSAASERFPDAAVVDLGSSSFHLLLARAGAGPGEIDVLERRHVRVGLAAGVDAAGRLAPAVAERALAVLADFADDLAGVPTGRRFGVGTWALRRLAEPRAFLDAAEATLGVPVTIVAGDDEARLTFRGALSCMPATGDARLVIDIGGGSTEFALGAGASAPRVHSVDVGCIGIDGLADGATDRADRVLGAALEAARARLADPALDAFRPESGVAAIGTSGTYEAVRDVLAAHGRADAAGDIEYGALRRFFDELRGGPALPRALPGLDATRVPVFPGGLAVLLAVFERLGLARMGHSPGTLQDGVLAARLDELGA